MTYVPFQKLWEISPSLEDAIGVGVYPNALQVLSTDSCRL